MHFISILIRQPKLAFQLITDRHYSAWRPFTAILSSLICFWFAYFYLVDQAWLYEFTLNTIAGDVSPAELEQVREITPKGNAFMYSTMLGSLIGVLLQISMLAVILNIFTKLDETNTDNFKDWFASICWVYLPLIPQLILGLAGMALSGQDQLMHYQLYFTSINQLLNWPLEHPLFEFVATFDVFSVWIYTLLFYMLSVKTNLKASTCLTLALIPIIADICISFILG